MIQQAAVLVLCLANGSAMAQIYADPIQSVGGGGRSVRISTGAIEPKDPAPPQKLRANMRYLTPGTVLAKKTVGKETWLQLEVKRKDVDVREMWIADYPGAASVGVQQKIPCVVVLGDPREEIQGRRLGYWLASGPYDLNYIRAFEIRRPGVPVD
jgi:hypothetical protein